MATLRLVLYSVWILLNAFLLRLRPNERDAYTKCGLIFFWTELPSEYKCGMVKVLDSLCLRSANYRSNIYKKIKTFAWILHNFHMFKNLFTFSQPNLPALLRSCFTYVVHTSQTKESSKLAQWIMDSYKTFRPLIPSQSLQQTKRKHNKRQT